MCMLVQKGGHKSQRLDLCNPQILSRANENKRLEAFLCLSANRSFCLNLRRKCARDTYLAITYDETSLTNYRPVTVHDCVQIAFFLDGISIVGI